MWTLLWAFLTLSLWCLLRGYICPTESWVGAGGYTSIHGACQWCKTGQQEGVIRLDDSKQLALAAWALTRVGNVVNGWSNSNNNLSTCRSLSNFITQVLVEGTDGFKLRLNFDLYIHNPQKLSHSNFEVIWCSYRQITLKPRPHRETEG